MSLIDVHIEMAKSAYFSELVSELQTVIKKKQDVLNKIKEESENKKSADISKDKSLLEELGKIEQELLDEIVRSKKSFDLPSNVMDKFAHEAGLKIKSKSKNKSK